MLDKAALLEKIHYQFKNLALLEEALRHRSAGSPNNERMEFLGDAILGIIIAEMLFNHYPEASEGELSRMRSILVNGVHLAEVAQELGLGIYIQLGSGELKSGGQQRPSILADALEALVGAVYLDSDFTTCCLCISRWYGERIENFSKIKPAKDPKSRLQEWAQAHQFPLPDYQATVSGKPHEQVFLVVCRIEGLAHIAEGTSNSRRRAEQTAAQHYLDLLV